MDCNDQRRDKHGHIVATCSLPMHLDPEHVDMHAGRSWVNIPRETVAAVRLANEMLLDSHSMN